MEVMHGRRCAHVHRVRSCDVHGRSPLTDRCRHMTMRADRQTTSGMACVPLCRTPSYFSESFRELRFYRFVSNATGSDELMELTNSSATNFGHEGPTSDIPRTCNIESIRRPAMWDGLHASGPERCVRTGQATAHAAARWEMLRSSCSATAAPLAIDL